MSKRNAIDSFFTQNSEKKSRPDNIEKEMPLLENILNGNERGEYVKIDLPRIVAIGHTKSGEIVNFEELLINGEKSGYVRCCSTQCHEKYRLRKIKMVRQWSKVLVFSCSVMKDQTIVW